MNDIVYAGRGNGGCKGFAVYFPEKTEEVIVIPPTAKFDFADNGLCVVLERALFPLKDITVLSDDGNSGLRSAAETAEFYFTATLPKKSLILGALGELIVAYVTAFTANGEFSPVVEIIRADVKKNVSDSTYSLEDTLKKLPLNYDYVRKLFKKETGETPHEFLLKQRMELAARLIRSGISNTYSNYSISQVSEACGFAEPLYFSRVFKKYYGVAPSGYGKTE